MDLGRLLVLVAVFLIGACSAEVESDLRADAGPVTSDGGLDASLAGRSCPPDSALTYESFGRPFMRMWCTSCHSSALSDGERGGAPAGSNFDTLEAVRSNRENLYRIAADDAAIMPPVGGPEMAERWRLGDWLACGAP